jgi:Protein of unknown function (DUF3592)
VSYDTGEIITQESLSDEPHSELALPENLFLLDPENKTLLVKDSRRFKFFRRRWMILLLLASILSVPLLILMQGGGGLVGEMQLAGSNIIAHGQVVAHRIGGGGGRGQIPLYFVSYRFNAPNQTAAYTSEQFVSKDTFDRLAVGDQVEVNYVPGNPAVSKLAGSQTDNTLHDNRLLMTWIGIISTLLAGGFVLLQLMRLLEDYRIQQLGHLLIGHINHCKGKLSVTGRSMASEDYGSALRGNYVIEIDYRFRTADNHEYRNREVRKRNDLVKAHLPAANTPIAVLFLDAKHFKAL